MKLRSNTDFSVQTHNNFIRKLKASKLLTFDNVHLLTINLHFKTNLCYILNVFFFLFCVVYLLAYL